MGEVHLGDLGDVEIPRSFNQSSRVRREAKLNVTISNRQVCSFFLGEETPPPHLQTVHLLAFPPVVMIYDMVVEKKEWEKARKMDVKWNEVYHASSRLQIHPLLIIGSHLCAEYGNDHP